MADEQKETICVCGGGNAAHTLTGLLAARGYTVNLFSPFEKEVAAFQAGINQGGITVAHGDEEYRGIINKTSSDPAEVVPQASILLVSVPAFAHRAMLEALKPHLAANATIGGFPAMAGFDWEARRVLGDRTDVVVFGLQTLPWACRLETYGQSCTILGQKKAVQVATAQQKDGPAVGAVLERLFAPIRFPVLGSLLCLSLANTGQLIHPGIMHGLYSGWDGTSALQGGAPLFYQGVTAEMAATLQAMSDEVAAVCAAVSAACPAVELGGVKSLQDWLLSSYAGDIGDDSSLQSAFNTNAAYQGLCAPTTTREADSALVPLLKHRYLSADLPFGLLVTRGIAELAGVATPTIDSVCMWAQRALDKEYLVDGQLSGKDVGSTRAPQAFGYTDLQEVVDMSL